MAILLTTLILFLLTISAILYRLYTILNPNRRRSRLSKHSKTRGKSTHLLIVLGSGGHTAEMIAMLDRSLNETDPTRRLNWTDFSHRTWVVGTTDAISAKRAKEFEEQALQLSADASESEATLTPGTSIITTVPRAREIHQPLLTTPLSSLRCLLACIIILLQQSRSSRGLPDVVLCNGPATATILILATVLLRFFDVGGCESKGKMRTVYVESWARVNRLSLSGRLLMGVVDRFLVQWPQLERATKGRGEYLGVLV